MSMEIKPTNFLTCLYGCALGLERPRKLNRKNFPSDQSAKIGPLENFPLYSIKFMLHYVVVKLNITIPMRFETMKVLYTLQT